PFSTLFRSKVAQAPDGGLVVMNKTGNILIKNAQGDEKERYPAVYGARLFFSEGQEVNVGDRILEWDPFAIPLISEVAGFTKLEDIRAGITVTEAVDPVTGLTTKTVLEHKDPSLQPRVAIVDASGNPILVPGTKRYAVYRLQVGATLVVSEGDEVGVGSIISKVAREAAKTKDITGGLPRVAELFEARKP